MENVVSAALTYEGADREFTVAFAHDWILTGTITRINDDIFRLTTGGFGHYFDASKVVYIRKRHR